LTDLRGQHDLGGMPAGPMEIGDHDVPPFGKLITAIFSALRQHDVTTEDEVRRALEDLPTEVYDQEYYERWGEAIVNLLEEKGILTRAEVEERMAALKAKLEAKT